jgi:FlaA1/EpsC-like NDP-sugar epimerase
MEDLGEFFQNQRVVVTGAAGTVGSELVRQLLTFPVAEVRALDNNESDLFFLGEIYGGDSRFQFFLADVRDLEKIKRMFQNMDIIFHTAAFKHVYLCERSPFDAVQTNIIGLQNVIRGAIAGGVKKVLFTSSDKAVNPTNVMGTTKLMGERLITAANAIRRDNLGTVFASTRFGNVAGSRGSVIPVFTHQIARGGPVTITDEKMTRFFMTLEEAVLLVMKSIQMAQGGEVFVTKMPVIRIKDLAEVMISLFAPIFGYVPDQVPIKIVGPRSGEKMYEELMAEEEIRRSLELEELFVVLPAFRNIYADVEYWYSDTGQKSAHRIYNSSCEPIMTSEEIKTFLLTPGVLPEELRVQV